MTNKTTSIANFVFKRPTFHMVENRIAFNLMLGGISSVVKYISAQEKTIKPTL